MQDFIIQHYMWVKSLHVISIISWMAGLLYLPRLFVYHADAVAGSELSETFKIMERRLLKFIMNPAMVATWIFGGLMLWGNPSLLQGGWMHAKITLVVLLTGFHHMLGAWRKAFVADRNEKSAKFFRKVNEVPTLLMIGIVILVIVKPF